MINFLLTVGSMVFVIVEVSKGNDWGKLLLSVERCSRQDHQKVTPLTVLILSEVYDLPDLAMYMTLHVAVMSRIVTHFRLERHHKTRRCSSVTWGYYYICSPHNEDFKKRWIPTAQSLPLNGKEYKKGSLLV